MSLLFKYFSGVQHSGPWVAPEPWASILYLNYPSGWSTSSSISPSPKLGSFPHSPPIRSSLFFTPVTASIRLSTELARKLGIILEFSLHPNRTLGTLLSYCKKRIWLVQATRTLSPEHSSQATSYMRPPTCPIWFSLLWLRCWIIFAYTGICKM